MLDEALKFAVDAHSGQKRKGSDVPYIVHPAEAVAIAATITSDDTVLAATALHDVVEDTPYNIDDIRIKFGSKVAELVAEESENKREDIPAEETWMLRKKETIEHLATLERNAKIICLADKLSNLRSMVRNLEREGVELWERFNQKDPLMHLWYYSSIYKCLEEFSGEAAYREYGELLGKMRDMIADV